MSVSSLLTDAALLEALPHYVFIKDVQSRYITCNQAFAELVGFDQPGDIQGKTDFDLPWQASGHQAKFFRQGDQDVIEGHLLKNQEETLVLPNQSPLIVRVNKKVLKNTTGQLIGILGVAEDITAEKDMKSALDNAHGRAQLAEQAKQRILEDIAHSLRTPLTGIIGGIDLLKKQLQPEQEKLFALIEDSNQALLRRINQLVDYLHTQQNHPLQASTFSTTPFINELSKLYTPLANKKSLPVDIKHDLPAQLIADHTHLISILLEVIVNAIEFTKQGKVTITLSYAKDTQQLICTVKDTGKGIYPQETQHIRQPFHRLTPAYQDETSGMGLGLSLVQAHVHAMGGTLSMESQPDQGRCVTCSIPVDSPQRKLLIIEDNPLAQRTLAMLLDDTDCVYDMAACAQDALMLLENNTYQLIISDLGLPDRDGISLAKQIKKQHPNLPMIALSAEIDHKKTQACLSAGMHSCYQKPLTSRELEEILAILPTGDLA